MRASVARRGVWGAAKHPTKDRADRHSREKLVIELVQEIDLDVCDCGGAWDVFKDRHGTLALSMRFNRVVGDMFVDLVRARKVVPTVFVCGSCDVAVLWSPGSEKDAGLHRFVAQMNRATYVAAT